MALDSVAKEPTRSTGDRGAALDRLASKLDRVLSEQDRIQARVDLILRSAGRPEEAAIGPDHRG